MGLDELYVAWQNGNRIERFGQFVLNRVSHLPRPQPDIFYEHCPKTAYNKLLEIWQRPTAKGN